MKKLFLLLICSFQALFVFSQNCDTGFLGTKTLYKNNFHKNSDPPAGYRAVFINQVGRHGARHLTKEVQTSLAFQLLTRADSLMELTDRGRNLLVMVNKLQKIEHGHTKSISAEGENELKDMGKRMAINYPGVFTGTSVLNEAITKEIRTKQSADAFLLGLQTVLQDTAKVLIYNDDADLRFYDASPAYKNFEEAVDRSTAKSALDSALNLDKINIAFTASIFKPGLAGEISKDDGARLASDVFGFATIVYSLDAEILQAGFTPDELNFKSFFTCQELSRLAIADDADEDLKKGPGTDNNGIQVRVAVPLLVNFINTTDEFIRHQKFNAQLRFAHAETIAPFAALLQIVIADKVCTQLTEVDKVWPAAKIIPLGANIQWVFYKKAGKPFYLVKVLLNEEEVHIDGLSAKSFPYYNWDDLRNLYINKLNRLHVNLTDDMTAYLVALK